MMPPLTYRPNLNGLTWNFRALNRIYLADCMDLMRAIMAEQEKGNPVFAKRRILAIVDPPYGIGYDESAAKGAGTQYGIALAPKGLYTAKGWDRLVPDSLFFSALWLVSGNRIIWGANHFNLSPSRGWVVWYKETNGNFSDAELAYTSFNKPVKLFKYRWNGMLQEPGRPKEARVHPTQKPEALMLWLLDNYAKPGDLILDTHSGSGVVARACIKRGFDFIACEIDPDYHRDSLRLLADAKAGIVPLTDDEVKRRGGQRTLF